MPITNATSAYLALYNLACMCGWGYALVLAGQSLAKTGGDLSKVWEAMGTSIHVAQWAMSLEMVHALLKLVNSPFLTTVLQVLSRLLLMVVIMLAPTASTTWQCGMMAISWALVEVPRYCFYLNSLLGPGGQTGVLYPIFWLRYSLFAILYPTGITGEVTRSRKPLTMNACSAIQISLMAAHRVAPWLAGDDYDRGTLRSVF